MAKVPKFLHALYTMLQDEDSSVLSWSPDGACFQVHDVARLEREVLPKYFKHGRLASFQRQLNNFGFRKWTKTRANVCTFSHDVLVQCHASCLGNLMGLYFESRALSAAAASPRSLKRQRSDESPRTHNGAHGVKRASVHRAARATGTEFDSAADVASNWSGAHASSAWVFDSVDVADACALDWDRGISDSSFGGVDLLLEPLSTEAPCEPIDWELAADCLAFADNSLVVSAFVHPGRACSIQMSC